MTSRNTKLEDLLVFIIVYLRKAGFVDVPMAARVVLGCGRFPCSHHCNGRDRELGILGSFSRNRNALCSRSKVCRFFERGSICQKAVFAKSGIVPWSFTFRGVRDPETLGAVSACQAERVLQSNSKFCCDLQLEGHASRLFYRR